MFERPAVGQGAVIVHIGFGNDEYAEADREFRELVRSADADVLAHIGGSRRVPDPRYFIGGGKVDEVAAAVTEHGAELVVFNHDLSPSQERNLEKRLQARVLDRAGLILDIFARRARSHEGKLQVELAQLQHLATRLVRGWSHLERQKGGIGLRGPGESQLETDRRLLNDRIKMLRDRLDKVLARRDQGRASRRRARTPVVSLVGYTNAGKSTLFNRLTGEDIYSADQLFATLDPTLRRMDVPVGEPLILADTVGFIRDLPHELVAAFRATLEETREADVLVHVIDVADKERRAHAREVNAVLEEIGASEVPQLEVFNKIDQVPGEQPRVEYDAHGKPVRVYVSAATGEGLDALRHALAAFCHPDTIAGTLRLPPAAGWLRAQLFELGVVSGEDYDTAGNVLLSVTLSQADLERITAQAGLSVDAVLVERRPVHIDATGMAETGIE
ncbi:ribosome rescue GTPase HflX [Salinisphaera sp. Q1T1-3]|uniref:ribosome rescue GTPase HflX n=1 Tax=Salinisphaera sp. Q1T1-3 TaxID=2321229 RepID=UPI000E741A7C|nr:ribosome rescue GTPase HflX [Salinisphaera sp. Q1T1-3]RJS93793.1 GTPase HflX [Salinisphaera sp. Q1T1-3]